MLAEDRPTVPTPRVGMRLAAGLLMNQRTIRTAALLLSTMAACGGAQDQTDQTHDRAAVDEHTGSPSTPTASTGSSVGTTPSGGTDPSPTASLSGFYVDPNSNSANWVKNNSGDPR